MCLVFASNGLKIFSLVSFETSSTCNNKPRMYPVELKPKGKCMKWLPTDWKWILDKISRFEILFSVLINLSVIF